ncbi:hypothetical protein LIER_41758 [Lithospermum erythrorhizon]|uniref:Reverse transcriptase domain-containing protein n=1 Tax=Lithospermum erythrorhizon TaxID=34254 RepID=A0AAV3RE13_LITER
MDYQKLNEPISVKEIEKSMLSTKKGKAPDPDGFTSEFYRDSWHVVKDTVTEVILTFFATGHMPRHLNSTIIALIPKVSNTKNIYYEDVTVNWEFLWAVNGSLHGHFKSTRGLRQCDPLSPYLFILVMECFTKMLQAENSFEYHPKCKEIGLVNVSFADDLFVLRAATHSFMKLIKNVLRRFGNVSGLHQNLGKSTSYFARVNDHEAARLSGVLGIPIASLPVRYLGISLTTKQINACDCRVLIEKIKGKDK